MSDAVVLPKVKTIKTKEYGDFQTPYSLTESICDLVIEKKFEPTILIEPSCGRGNFIVSALKKFPSIEMIIAIEIQQQYKEELFDNLSNNDISIDSKKFIFLNSSFFDVELSELFKSQNIREQDHRFLILGNPPWVTNSFLGTINSYNIPTKSNSKTKFKGLDALTGKSNFDISESFIAKLIDFFNNKTFFMAMICKTATTQNIVKNSYIDVSKNELSAYLFNAKKTFSISASANVFVINNSIKKTITNRSCKICSLENSNIQEYYFGYSNGYFVSNIELYHQVANFEGDFTFQWRQGLKHDAGSILVLEKLGPGIYKNKLGEQIELEDEFIYPFLKSSDIKENIITNSRFYVIVTQNKIGEDSTQQLAKFPRIWLYLNEKKSYFLKRKSKIYANQSDFCIFGIGDYSFKPYKIVISGFYKKLHFSLVLPKNGKPIMIDDTCYSLSFNSLGTAIYIWLLLLSQEACNFYTSITFLEGKRPYKKDILRRLDLKKLMDTISDTQLKEEYNKHIKNKLHIPFEDLLKKKLNLRTELNYSIISK